MIAKLLDRVFGCWHSHYSFPITVKNGGRRRTPATNGTYVVCLDCGKELAYDWHEMKVVEGHTGRSKAAGALAAKEAA